MALPNTWAIRKILVINILSPHSRRHLSMGLVLQRCQNDLSEEFEDAPIEVYWQVFLMRYRFTRTNFFVQ